MSGETLNTKLSNISKSLEILKSVTIENTKWCDQLRNTVLYTNTVMDSTRNFKGTHEIVRKNIYYLANNTPNVPQDLIDSLVNSGIINEREKQLIMEYDVDKLRGLKMYAILSGKDNEQGRIQTQLRNALLDSLNFDAVAILHNWFPDLGLERDAAVINHAAGDLDGAIATLQGWSCGSCTYLNPDSTHNICEMCNKTKGFELEQPVAVNMCNQCTFINPVDARNCELCDCELDNEFELDRIQEVEEEEEEEEEEQGEIPEGDNEQEEEHEEVDEDEEDVHNADDEEPNEDDHEYWEDVDEDEF